MTFSPFGQCWAASLGGCDDISEEHLLSRGVTEVLGRFDVKINMHEQRSDIPSNAAQPQILCERHNKALSIYDTEAKNFFSEICRYNRDSVEKFMCNGDGLTHRVVVVNGWNIERWFLKTFLNHTLWTGGMSKDEYLIRCAGDNAIRYLFDGEALPSDLGLFRVKPDAALPYRKFMYLSPEKLFHMYGLHATGCLTNVQAGTVRNCRVPVGHYLRLFGGELTLIANITTLSDDEWRRQLSRLPLDPRSIVGTRVAGTVYQRLRRADEPEGHIGKLMLHFDWSGSPRKIAHGIG